MPPSLAPPGLGTAPAARLATDAIFDQPIRSRPAAGSCLVGVLAGEGIGSEVTEAALEVLRAVEQQSGRRFAIEHGGTIGLPALKASGQCLTDEVRAFCRSIFDRGGAILAGAGGGRFVYEFRKRFGLFCKLNPIVAWPEMDRSRVVKCEAVRSTDLLVVRENLGGLYQGVTNEVQGGNGSRVLEHRFGQSENHLRRFLRVAARLAAQRRGNLAVIVKAGGLPELAALWRGVAEEAAAVEGVECRCVDVDYACYLMLDDPRGLDVIAAPNCFADILSDLGGLLMGGRGLTFGASFGKAGEAVYQTNHGAAYDLQGTGKGNPLGQILSMGMMLRESFGLVDEAEAVEAAVRRVLGRGLCTGDIAWPGCTVVGTTELAAHIAGAIGTHFVPSHAPAALPDDRRKNDEAIPPDVERLPAAVTARGPVATRAHGFAHRSPRDTRFVAWAGESAGEDGVSAAVVAARDAWPTLGATAEGARCRWLTDLAALLGEEATAGELARQIVVDVGKPLREARAEVERCRRLLGASVSHAGGPMAWACDDGSRFRRVPQGVVAAITPWNHPLAIAIGKIAPALLYGNTVVWKPAPAGTRLAVTLLGLMRKAGWPGDVVTLACGGTSTAQLLMEHPGVDAITLTGGRTAGAHAGRVALLRHVPLQAELGGNNAAIVWSDRDEPQTAALLVSAAFGFAGQRCTANRRVIVPRQDLTRLVETLAAATAELVWGDPLDVATVVGPLVSEESRMRVAIALAATEEAGHRVITPHAGIASDLAARGWYVSPAIVVCGDPDADIVQRELFGPVLVVQPADGWDHAIALCNGVEQGLVAALFTGEEDRWTDFQRRARAGILKWNRATADAGVEAPFGGWKASGIGPPEHGPADLEFHTRFQAIHDE